MINNMKCYNFFTISLAWFVFVAHGLSLDDKDLFKYENEESEREAFRRVNSWILDHVPLTSMEKSINQLKGLKRGAKSWRHRLPLVRILLGSQPFDSVARYVIQAIKQLEATTLIGDSNRCDTGSNRLLLRIFKGLYGQEGTAEKNRLQQLVLPIFKLHATQCYNLYPQKYAEIMSKLPLEVKRSVDSFLDKIVDMRFVTKQVGKGEMAVILFESLKEALPEGESLFGDRTVVEYDKNLNRLRELLERHLRCRDYYQALGPEVFELASMDRFFHHEREQVSDLNLAEFYQSWSKVRICKWIAENPDTMAKNMMFYAVVDLNNSES